MLYRWETTFRGVPVTATASVEMILENNGCGNLVRSRCQLWFVKSLAGRRWNGEDMMPPERYCLERDAMWACRKAFVENAGGSESQTCFVS